MYVPNMADHTISVLNTDAMTVSTISTGANFAPVLLAADANGVYAAATVGGEASQGAILALRDGFFTKVADAPGFTDLAVTGTELLWTATPKGSATAEVCYFDQASGSETISKLGAQANSLKVMSDGTLLAYQVGDTQASVLDPYTLQTRGSVSFAKGIWGFSGDYAALSDGSIGKVAIGSDGLGNPKANFTAIDTAEGNYGSFAVDDTSKPGVATVYSVNHGANGIAMARVHVVPLYGGRN